MGVGAALLVSALIGAGTAASQQRTARKTRKRSERAQAEALRAPVETEGAVEEVKGVETDIKKRRLNLFRTEGGVSGEELQPGQVSQRRTLLGN